MSATDFITIIRPLDQFSEHKLHPDAIDRAYRVYLTDGPEAASRFVRLIREAFRDVQNDNYLTPEVMA